ncbi:MAG: hypothetical protein ABUT20_60795, partial [Bacteroidota bacterium]
MNKMNNHYQTFEKIGNRNQGGHRMVFGLKQFLLAAVVLVFSVFTANAQLANVPLTSGSFNDDVIANGIGATNTATTGTMPGVTYPTIGIDGVGYTFVDNTYKWYSGTAAFPTCGVPATISSSLTPGLVYSTQSASANNSMSIASNTYAGSVLPTTGSIALSTPANYSKLYVLYETVQNTTGPTITATVTFSDATTQIISGISFVNWFTNSGTTYSNMQRAQNVAAGGVSGCGG